MLSRKKKRKLRKSKVHLLFLLSNSPARAICFEVLYASIFKKKENTAKYELKLPSDKMFAAVHGEVKLYYTVYLNEGTVMLATITPTEILLEGHMSELSTYKGIMISKANASKDKFKIDLLNKLQEK